MTNSVARTLKRTGILSVAGAIALSASAIVSPSAFAASPYTNSSDQPLYQTGQQPPQDGQYPNRKPQSGQSQNGQTQNGQPQNGQPQSGQIQNGQAQNGQWQNGQWQNGQGQNNQNGQWQNGQAQNGQWQNGQGQNNQNGQWQNGQWHNNQNGQWQNGQPNSNTYARQRYDWSAYRPGHQPPQWQQYHRDFNPHSYQWNRTSNQRYHYQTYQRPHGWYAQRWAYGQILPRLFWSQNYWLTGYYNFGLIDPPYGYVWVQNGNDALLVDVQNGQILSVEYNIFYS